MEETVQSLRAGFQLINSHALGDDDIYIIEKVVDKHPIWPGHPIASGADIKPFLGSGGFGITYLASRQIKVGHNDTHKVYYAIKEYFVKDHCSRQDDGATVTFNPAFPAAKQGMAEFKSEANRLKSLCKSIPGIVKVHDVFEANGTAYYVMEYLNGGSLRDRVKELHPDAMSEEQVLRLMLPLLKTVKRLHEERLLHCDIKPDNIMLQIADDGQEHPVLIDFGETIHFDKSGDATSQRTFGGTPGYMPIEQTKEERMFDPRFDIYALGATMYHLLVGKRPVDAFDMTADILERELPTNISPRLRKAIKHAMEKLAENRTPTVDDLIKELDVNKSTSGSDECLHSGYILHHDAYDYRIVKQERRTPEYIVYRVIRQQHQSSKDVVTYTEAFPYVLYEFFEQNVAKRQKDGRVEAVDKTSEAYSGFSKLNHQCRNKAGYASFEANGTEYFVHLREVRSSWIVRMVESLKRNLSGISVVTALAVFASLAFGYFFVDVRYAVPVLSCTSSTNEADTDTVVVPDPPTPPINPDSIKKKEMEEFLSMSDENLKNAIARTGTKAAIQMVLDANYYYYDKAGSVHEELYGKKISPNPQLDSVKRHEFDYWVQQGDNLGGYRYNYAKKKACYENAYRLMEKKYIKDRIDWLNKQLGVK